MSGDGATFPRLHVWSSNETILPIDLNAEFDNVLNNFTFEGLDDYELNVTQMRKQTDPGGLGTESLATSGAGEVERIRFVLARIQGTTYWYESGPISLTQANELLNAVIAIPPNRLDSGVPVPLLPHPTTNSVILDGSPTPFRYHVSGNPYTINSDVTFSGLTLGSAAAASQVLVNDPALTAQESSKVQGENGTLLTFDTDGSHTGIDIVARLNKLSAFRIVHAATTEYFIATVTSATTLGDARRGFFFDSNGNPIGRITIADEDVITLMELAYMFVTTSGAMAVTYNAPTYSATQPVIAFAGDYWLDFTTQVWKTFNGAAWVTANATFLGLAIQDSSKTVGARATEYFAGYAELNTIVLKLQDSTHVTGSNTGEQINVAGRVFKFETSIPSWSSVGQFAPGVVLSPNTTYYAYVEGDGHLILDAIPPYDRTMDLRGFYHPYQTWRAAGFVTTDGASLFGASPTGTYNNPSVGQAAFNKILGTQIAPLTITGGNLALPCVGTGNIVDAAVTEPKLATNSVTSTKIAAAQIDGTKLVNNINLPGPSVAVNGLFVVVSTASTTLGIIRGAFDGATGALVVGEGFTSFRSAVGVYLVGFNSAFTTLPAVTATVYQTANVTLMLTSVTTNSISFEVRNLSGTLTDSTIMFIAVSTKA